MKPVDFVFTFEKFKKMMEYDVVKNHACIEVEFCIESSSEYDCCFLGKTISQEVSQAVYWYGLTQDGLQAYDFDTLDEFIFRPVFNGKNIQEIWNSVRFIAIDTFDVEMRLSQYLGEGPCPIRGPARFVI